jgi:cell division protein FtsA
MFGGGERGLHEDIFVLDIGTRSVMALLAKMEKDELIVSHLCFKEHRNRAMQDGQIHDVQQVTEIIEDLLLEIKSLSGTEIKKVAVAAAGRSLKTVKGKARLKYPVSSFVSENDHSSLKMQAVQDAQFSLPKNQTEPHILSQQYYCVGYTVTEERLDGIRLSSIIGQKGQEAEVDVLATFLPRIVVESLLSAVLNVGLELHSITLEPIAVANIVLNQAMRRLNLVLVDIGAGTADIAVCGDSAITAYGMVPLAGDEITETLSDNYLLDFNKAEEVKRKLCQERDIYADDVLGNRQLLCAEEIITDLKPSLDNICFEIAKEIFELNGKAPQALLLVGGGSLLPGLVESMAEVLGMPANRVAVQQAGMLQNVRNLPEEFSGPMFITVLGIALTALTLPTRGFISVKINEREIKLLNIAQNSVAEVMLAGGYSIKEIYGRPGQALSFEINNELHTIPGKPGKPGSVFLNGIQALFGDKVKDGDNIKFEPGLTGENGRGTFREILQEHLGNCFINGKIYTMQPTIIAEGKALSLDDPISEGMKVFLQDKKSIKNILQECSLYNESEVVWLNDSEVSLLELAQIKRNGKKVGPEETAVPKDQIYFKRFEKLTVQDLVALSPEEVCEVFVNGDKIKMTELSVWVNKEPADLSTIIRPGDRVEYKRSGQTYRPILVDIFNIIDFSPQPPKNKSKLILLHNGSEAEYTQELKNGDKIKIYWA